MKEDQSTQIDMDKEYGFQPEVKEVSSNPKNILLAAFNREHSDERKQFTSTRHAALRCLYKNADR